MNPVETRTPAPQPAVQPSGQPRPSGARAGCTILLLFPLVIVAPVLLGLLIALAEGANPTLRAVVDGLMLVASVGLFLFTLLCTIAQFARLIVGLIAVRALRQNTTSQHTSPGVPRVNDDRSKNP